MLAAPLNNVRIRGKVRHEEWPKIAERFRRGETLAEIARSYRCTAPAIRYIIRRVEQGWTGRRMPESAPTAVLAESRRGPAQVVSVDGRTHAGRPAAVPCAGEVWDRVSSDIASFLAAMDALSEADSDDNCEALLLATDRLLRATARTRLELERVLDTRKIGSRKRREKSAATGTMAY